MDGIERRARTARPRRWRASLLAATLCIPVVCGASPAHAQESGDPEVRDLLARAEATYDGLSSMRARFVQKIDKFNGSSITCFKRSTAFVHHGSKCYMFQSDIFRDKT